VSETLTEALHRLGREGFARRFERVGDALRCASCEVSFPPEELLVEDVVEVADATGGPRTTLYALECTDCGAKGVWILADGGPEDRALAQRLRSGEPPGRDPGHDRGHGRAHDQGPGPSGPAAPAFGT
jgi:hypothetical protein